MPLAAVINQAETFWFTFSGDASVSADLLTGTFTLPSVSLLTDQILAQVELTGTFSLPAVTVTTSGDVTITPLSALELVANLQNPSVVTDAVINVNTQMLVLTIIDPIVTTPTPSTAKISRVYLFLGIR